MILEFKNGYIELHEDGTNTIVGEDAHTFFLTFYREMRKNNISLDDTNEMFNKTIKELAQ